MKKIVLYIAIPCIFFLFAKISEAGLPGGTSIVTDATVDTVSGISYYYPATGYGTLAFEDLWPSMGDFDFNDLVVDYKFEIMANMNNYMKEVIATFNLRAFGASFRNGFGFQLSSTINPGDLMVSGCKLTENYISLNNRGMESGQSKPTIIVFDNSFAQLRSPGSGVGVNTTPSAPYVTPKTIVITIRFKPNTYTINDLDISNFNPFMIINMSRGREVHLPYYPPTALADPAYFGTFEDNSIPSLGRYYVNASCLPWAISTYESFSYPAEKNEILWAYPKFSEWVTSSGTACPDWYKNLPGYRNIGMIYPKR